MNETLTALVLLYFGSTAFLGIGHYKSDGGWGKNKKTHARENAKTKVRAKIKKKNSCRRKV